jgi:hypothetical protein
MGGLKNVCCVALALSLSFVFVNSANAIRILMHGREPGATFRDDPFVLQHLESAFGADNVDYLRGADAAADGSSATGYDVVYISSTMASGDTRGKYEDSPVGIVFGENALAHDDNVGNFMLSDLGTNNDNVTDRDSIMIENPSHPLAAGLSGEVTVLNSPINNYWWQYARGTLAPGVQLIASGVIDPAPAEPHHAIVAADVGAQLLGDGTDGRPMTATGRRVFFFLSDFGAVDLTEDGKKLFNAAFTWAAEDPAGAVPGDYNGNGTVDAADYVLWRDGGPLMNEVHNSGTVTAEDYNEWRARFGNTAAPALGIGTSSVPEPAALVAASIGTAWVVLVACTRSRRRVNCR